jgi:hypothetical protein
MIGRVDPRIILNVSLLELFLALSKSLKLLVSNHLYAITKTLCLQTQS